MILKTGEGTWRTVYAGGAKNFLNGGAMFLASNIVRGLSVKRSENDYGKRKNCIVMRNTGPTRGVPRKSGQRRIQATGKSIGPTIQDTPLAIGGGR